MTGPGAGALGTLRSEAVHLGEEPTQSELDLALLPYGSQQGQLVGALSVRENRSVALKGLVTGGKDLPETAPQITPLRRPQRHSVHALAVSFRAAEDTLLQEPARPHGALLEHCELDLLKALGHRVFTREHIQAGSIRMKFGGLGRSGRLLASETDESNQPKARNDRKATGPPSPRCPQRPNLQRLALALVDHSVTPFSVA